MSLMTFMRALAIVQKSGREDGIDGDVTFPPDLEASALFRVDDVRLDYKEPMGVSINLTVNSGKVVSVNRVCEWSVEYNPRRGDLFTLWLTDDQSRILMNKLVSSLSRRAEAGLRQSKSLMSEVSLKAKCKPVDPTADSITNELMEGWD